MEPIENWTRDYFLSNQEICISKIKQGLSPEEKIKLRSNLYFKENGSFVLLNHSMITDIKEPEYYCEKIDIKKGDGSVRTELGKYIDKIDMMDDENFGDPAENLENRQICIVTRSDSNNSWIQDFESFSMNTNKRKIENDKLEKSYLIKIYEGPEVLLNQLVEVVGFLYSTMAQPDLMDENGEETILPSYVIHAVHFKEMEHNNPILLHEIEEPTILMEEIHTDLLRLLTQLLFGDELCANYMLCHLISCVYSRVNEEALGKFCLNIICHSIPNDVNEVYTKRLYSLVENLVPNSVYFPLTIENLNTIDLIPKKDYTTNNLVSGLLQLPKNTHVFLDETKLENGKLDQAGCLAISHLSELIRSQQLSYDFQYYKLPFSTDYPILIISEGKSLLPSDFAVPIKPADNDSVRLIEENFTAAMHYMRPKINLFRRYLTKCRLEKFDIGEEETKMIETDFVKMRESSNFQVENLHSLLVLSRLLGLSRGLKKLDVNVWEMAKRFETERSSRMEKRNTNEP